MIPSFLSSCFPLPSLSLSLSLSLSWSMLLSMSGFFFTNPYVRVQFQGAIPSVPACHLDPPPACSLLHLFTWTFLLTRPLHRPASPTLLSLPNQCTLLDATGNNTYQLLVLPFNPGVSLAEKSNSASALHSTETGNYTCVIVGPDVSKSWIFISQLFNR